jgi:hypothetical protein
MNDKIKHPKKKNDNNNKQIIPNNIALNKIIYVNNSAVLRYIDRKSHYPKKC